MDALFEATFSPLAATGKPMAKVINNLLLDTIWRAREKCSIYIYSVVNVLVI